MLEEIHQLLLKHFNESELNTLCLGLGIEYEDLAGQERPAKARQLIKYLQRQQRLGDLKTAVLRQRPMAVWPTTTSTPPLPPAINERWQLTSTDSDQLATILATLPEFRSSSRRIDFLDDVFAGSTRQQDILSLIDVDGAPRGTAVRLINRLTNFGQDEPGQETLGVLINKLLTYVGSGPEADFLRRLFDRYPLKTTPAATRALDNWSG